MTHKTGHIRHIRSKNLCALCVPSHVSYVVKKNKKKLQTYKPDSVTFPRKKKPLSFI